MLSGNESDLDPCGESETTPGCAEDWDLDGVADEDEPLPSSLLGQIAVQQCTLNGNVSPPSADRYSETWMDQDEQDEDEQFTRDPLTNVGGRSGSSGEEAFVQVTVTGGAEYLIVVGATSGGTGVYEISIREIL
jgi:hypothetical protein